jgi:hypothetical protein
VTDPGPEIFAITKLTEERIGEIETALADLRTLINGRTIRNDHRLTDSTISRLSGTGIIAGQVVLLASRNGLAGGTAPNVRQIFECFLDLYYIVIEDEPERSIRCARLLAFELIQREKQFGWMTDVFKDRPAMTKFLGDQLTPEDFMGAMLSVFPDVPLMETLAVVRAEKRSHWSGVDRNTLIDRLAISEEHRELTHMMKSLNKSLGILGHGGAGWTSGDLIPKAEGHVGRRFASPVLAAELIVQARMALESIRDVARIWDRDAKAPEPAAPTLAEE